MDHQYPTTSRSVPVRRRSVTAITTQQNGQNGQNRQNGQKNRVRAPLPVVPVLPALPGAVSEKVRTTYERRSRFDNALGAP